MGELLLNNVTCDVRVNWQTLSINSHSRSSPANPKSEFISESLGFDVVMSDMVMSAGTESGTL